MPINYYIDEIEKKEDYLRTHKYRLAQISGIPRNKFKKFHTTSPLNGVNHAYKSILYDEESRNKLNFFEEDFFESFL